MDTNTVITITEASRQLNMTRSALYKAIELGRIRSQTVLGRRVLYKQDVEAYRPRPYVGIREANLTSEDESPDYDPTLTPADRVALLETWADSHERGEQPLLDDAAITREAMYTNTERKC